MNQQETIAALTIELTRIGKMPEWIRAYEGFIYDAFASKISPVVARNYEAVLSALLGVAAEVVARADIVIRTNGANKFQIYGWLGDTLSPFWFGSYPQAVIAALKQV